MEAKDVIIRRGSRGKEVVVGPAFLAGPTSDKRTRVGTDIDRITGDVDFYEVSDSLCGIPTSGTAPTGSFSFAIEPFMERGFKRYIKAIRTVAVIRMKADGTTELLFRKSVPSSDRKFLIGDFKCQAGQRLFLSIERLGGVSSIQYKLTLNANVLKPSPTRRTKKVEQEPAPLVEKTEADKAWDLVNASSED